MLPLDISAIPAYFVTGYFRKTYDYVKRNRQADIRMRSYGLRQLDEDSSVASCQQTCSKLIVKTGLPQACCNLSQHAVTIQVF